MKSPEDIKPFIVKLYSEMGRDPDDLRHFSENDMIYHIIRNDFAKTSLRRKDVDDYIDSNDPTAKINIINSLNDFKPNVEKSSKLEG